LVNKNFFYFNFYTMQGTVKFFNEAKGFGFIKPSNSSTDIFVHTSGLVDEIRENDEVTYDEATGKKGMNAVNVTRIMD
jgi:CspA family cold shock protein